MPSPSSKLLIGLLPMCLLACSSGTKLQAAGGMGGAAALVDTCAPSTDCGPPADDFFSNAKLAEVRITIDPQVVADTIAELRRSGHEEKLETWLDVLWGKWQHCGPYENFLPVTMEYKSADRVGNVVMKNVGMRLRGTKSRGRNEIPGFKLDFGALLPPPPEGMNGRRFAGETKISVLSLEGDHSLMLQCAAYQLMRDYGDVPAPRCNHLKVYVNGTYFALVQNVEEVDDSRFIRRVYKSSQDDGALYACSGGCGYDDSFADLEYYGPTFGDYQKPLKYEPLRTVDAPEAELIPMLKCGDNVQTPDDAVFKACIQEWIDVKEWLKLIAAESLMPTLQSFLGAKRNFFLYFQVDATAPHGGRFQIYSWDYDAAMLRESCYPSDCNPLDAVTGWYGPAGKRAKLAVRLTRVFRTEYCAAMNEFLDGPYKPSVIDRMEATLEPTVATETFPFVNGANADGSPMPRDPLTHDEWLASNAKIRQFITSHGATARAQVNAICSTGGAQ